MRLLRSIHLVPYHRPILVFRVNTIKRIPSRGTTMYHKPEQSQWNNGWFANDLSWLNNPRAMHFSLWKPHRMRMECKGKVSSSSSGRKDGMAGLVCCSMESSHHFIPLKQNPTFRKCHTVHNCCPKLCCSCCAWVRTISSSLLCLANTAPPGWR